MRTVESLHVRAMGTDAHLVVVGGPLGLITHAADRLAQLEDRWSRFRPRSDVARANAQAGHPVAVHDDTLLLVQRAAEAWRATAGRFDPTVHDALVALGYDRPYAQLVADAHRPGRRSPVATSGAPGCAGIELDLDAGLLRLPPGVHLDPGGIGKGLAADLVAEELRSLGAAGALVNIGGDLRVSGAAPDAIAWRIEVEDPFSIERSAGVLCFASGQDIGVATSSTLGRRWVRDGAHHHHLIDPCTGASAVSTAVAATVVGTRAWWCDVAAKLLLLDAAGWPSSFGAEPPALVATTDGRLVARSGIEAYLQPHGSTAVPVIDQEVPACSAR